MAKEQVNYQSNKVDVKAPKSGESVNVFVRPGDKLNLGFELKSAEYKLVGGDMMFDYSKGDMLGRIQTVLGVSNENTMVIGDGANDRSMFVHAGKRVAFCAKPILKASANIIVDEKNLENVIEYI